MRMYCCVCRGHPSNPGYTQTQWRCTRGLTHTKKKKGQREKGITISARFSYAKTLDIQHISTIRIPITTFQGYYLGYTAPHSEWMPPPPPPRRAMPAVINHAQNLAWRSPHRPSTDQTPHRAVHHQSVIHNGRITDRCQLAVLIWNTMRCFRYMALHLSHLLGSITLTAFATQSSVTVNLSRMAYVKSGELTMSTSEQEYYDMAPLSAVSPTETRDKAAH